MLPKFEVREDWNSEDVTIYFEDEVSASLHNYVCSELDKVVPQLNKESRTTYHLEHVINTIFSNAIIQKRLGKTNKIWTIR